MSETINTPADAILPSLLGLETPEAAPAPATPIDQAARTEARAEQAQAERVHASIAAMRQDAGIALAPSTAPISARPAPQRTVTVRYAAPITVGEGSLASTQRTAAKACMAAASA